jgi:succinoglycan biosynthesis protein ExoU
MQNNYNTELLGNMLNYEVDIGCKSSVDVIIAARNCAGTVSRAISSALADAAVRAIFVIDDASTDETALAARKENDGTGRLFVETLPVNKGPAAARNHALCLGAAPWIAILDGDDYFLPQRLSKMVALADGHDFVADALLQVPEGKTADEAVTRLRLSEAFTPWVCDLEAFVLGNVSRKGQERKELGFFKPIVRRSFLEQHGLRYDETLRLGEDYALYARALARGARFLVVPPQGYVAVVRPDSLSGRHTKQDLERLRDSDHELLSLSTLSRAERLAIERHYRSVDAKVQWLEVIEAVKARNPRRFTSAFLRSRDVARFISLRLIEQAKERSASRLGLKASSR